MVKTGKMEFTVDSQLLGELGEKLVSKNYIALAELIKNAYDADATKIIIRFRIIDENTSHIHLIDNGLGMTFENVEKNWMTIATTDKVYNPYSKIYGRKKTGSKGIGRFACRRLAKSLFLKTQADISEKNKIEKTKVTFNWDEFIPGTRLAEIKCDYETEIIENGEIGTILELVNLNDKWTKRNFNTLKRHILELSIAHSVRREGFIEDPGFEIIFDAPDFIEGEGQLIDMFTDAGWGKLEGEITKNGSINIVLEAMEIGKIKYTLPKKFNKLYGIGFDIGIIILNSKYFRNPILLTQAKIRELMFERGGVRVYLDNFRIYPYGEKGDDWLGLERDKARSKGQPNEIFKSLAKLGPYPVSRSMFSQPSNYNLIGKILITSENKNFIVKLDREGFVENDAYNQLVEMLRLIMEWTTLQHNKSRFIIDNRELEKDLEDLEETLDKDSDANFETSLITAIKILKNESKRNLDLIKIEERPRIKKRINSASKIIERTINSYEIYSSLLSAVATTGVYLMTFYHEIRNLITRLDTNARTIERLSKNFPKEKNEELKILSESLLETSERFEQLSEIFLILGEKTKNQEKFAIEIQKECNEIIKGFQYMLNDYDIKFELDISEDLLTKPMLKAEFFSIIANLVSNSIKAIIAGSGKKFAIKGFRNENLVLRISNDGIKLNEKYWKRVFEPLVIDPENLIYTQLEKKIKHKDVILLGKGSGLGLTIVKEIIDRNNGEIKFVKPEKPWKTEIEMKLP